MLDISVTSNDNKITAVTKKYNKDMLAAKESLETNRQNYTQSID